MSWGAFAGVLALALFIIAYLYFKVRQNEAAQAALKAEEEKRLIAEAAFAEAQRQERAKDVKESNDIHDRAGAIGFVRDTFGKN